MAAEGLGDRDLGSAPETEEVLSDLLADNLSGFPIVGSFDEPPDVWDQLAPEAAGPLPCHGEHPQREASELAECAQVPPPLEVMVVEVLITPKFRYY